MHQYLYYVTALNKRLNINLKGGSVMYSKPTVKETKKASGMVDA